MKRKIIGIFISFLLVASIIHPMAYAETRHDFAEESSVTEEQLESALYYELSEYADVFVQCEKEYGVNAQLLASLAALESGWARSDLAVYKNNLFGWKRSNGEYATFESKEQCILKVAEAISENYLNEAGAYYTGDTLIDNVAQYYSPSEEWKNLLKEVADGIIERCNEYEKEEMYFTKNFSSRIQGRITETWCCRIEFQKCAS